MKILFFFIILLLSKLYAGRNIANEPLPWSESFNTFNYSDLLWNSGNGSHEHEATGGWNNSGCVKITPGTIPHNYYCIGQINAIGGRTQKVVHIRWLQWFSSNFASEQPPFKNLILVDGHPTSDNAQDRPMIITGLFENRMTVSVADDTTKINYDNSPHIGIFDNKYPIGNDEFYINDYTDQWVCFEYVADINTHINTLYIWTRDGIFSGFYSSISNSIETDRFITDIDILGLYINNARSENPNPPYIKIDELVISNSFIGPPSGFLENIITAPNNLRITN